MKQSPGFTLIEMMVVMAIIALVAAMAVPSITSYFQVSLTSASREMSSTIKEAYNSTMITGLPHRMAYDIKTSEYWVEVSQTMILLDTKESLERIERRKRLSKSDEPPPSSFAMDKTVTRKKLKLPTGVSFEDLVTQQSPEPITEGTAYTHFFPHGLIEQTIIHLKDQSSHKVSLVISPVVGKTDMYERYLTAKEAFEPK